jgi:lysophospholipase L1-like esterase
VVILGDSITDKWPRLRPHFFADTGWVGRGITSETTPQMLLRFQQDVIALRPKIVVILAGTNDVAGNSGAMSPDDTLYYLAAMVDIARNAGITPVLCKILPAADFPWSPGLRPDEKIPALNARVEDYALREGLTLVNFFDVMSDGRGGMRAALSDDGVHPNNLGYATMESRLRAQLEPLLN